MKEVVKHLDKGDKRLMGHLFITGSKNRTTNIRRMSGDLAQKLAPKVVSVKEFSSVNGMERATARVVSCRELTADAKDKFFVDVCRIFVG
jgi:hypothetical protein